MTATRANSKLLTGDFRPGDSFAFLGRSLPSRLIARLSCPPLYWPEFRAILRREPHYRYCSHFGMCCDYHGKTWLVESTTLCETPCLYHEKRVSGVQAHYPSDRIEAYDGYVWRFRPAEGWRLTNDERSALTRLIYHQLENHYDLLGALRSATDFPAVRREQVRFCSDLVAAAYMRVGRLGLTNSKGYTPSGLAKTLVNNGNFEIARVK